LAPLVLVIIVALLRFIGCDLVWNVPPVVLPPFLQATAGDSLVTLSWDPSFCADSYNVKRGTTSGGPYTQISSGTATSHTDSGLTNGTTYYYVVTAVKGWYQLAVENPSNQAQTTPAAVLGRPPGSVLDTGNPLSTNLIGLFLMNEGHDMSLPSFTTNLVDLKAANFSGAALPTWNTDDPSVVFNGGGSLNSYLDADETGGASAFDQLPISQITVVAKVFVNAPLVAAGVCEKNDGNTGPADSGFVFGWDNTGALRLTVEKSTTNMRVATAGSIVVPGNWIQVAFTWDGTPGHGTAADAHLFMNGAEQPKASAADGSGTLGYANATNQPFRIGNASYDPMAGCLNGKMAYLAIYKGRILMPTEINQLDTQLPITY
jgi:hypothetical protein